MAVILCLALVSGVGTAYAQAGQQASAELRDPSGQIVGSATFTPEGAGVRVVVQARNLTPGRHGIHVHAVGRCDPPDFMSAGGHFNPTSRQHGLRNPRGAHAGDVPNLEVAANGTASFNTVTSAVSLGSGPTNLFDADGSALVIHADPDDDVTDPTGNSGGRVACGVITLAARAQPSPAPAQAPRALPRTGDASGLVGTALPLVAGGLTLILAAFAVRRRR